MPVIYGDLENRGVSELVTGSGLHRNQGMGELRVRSLPRPAMLPGLVRAVAGADFDADGRLDLAAVGGDGELIAPPQPDRDGPPLAAGGLEGVKNLRSCAPGAEVEVKAGSRYQKKIYEGQPLHFGLGARAEVDTVRITWPNGLIQNEPRQAGAPTYKEAQRLSGSCPMIYTWNGEEFEFITDVLGVAPLGASAGDGEYFPVDHDEYIQIPESRPWP